MSLAEYLARCEKRYRPEHALLGGPFKGPGYHSRVPDGTLVHDILNSLDYAIGLLESGAPAHVGRAVTILRKVLWLQDRDPTSPTYGVWPWLLEEPLAAMAPPDWNWADFGGARLAQVLAMHTARLPADLAQRVMAALAHAAWSIFRRNVGPSYTNIAVTGAGVTVAAGELLNVPRLLDYGRRRIGNVVEHTKFHGGFNEYNSPPYTMVVLHECERVLALVRDEQVRADAEWLRRVAWMTIADHFHPGTGQWAGPHSRAYGLRLSPVTARYLSEQTGVAIGAAAADAERRSGPPTFGAQPCPSRLVPRFLALPQPELQMKRRFIRREPTAASTVGTTWMGDDACLGSVNEDCLWTQRRAVLAYWRSEGGLPAVLRLRFLHNGRDFASAMVRSAQVGPRVLSVIGLASNLGDFHLHLDRPQDGVFEAEDFRVRYEVDGPWATAAALGDGRFELGAGRWRAVLHIVPGCFGPHEVQWSVYQGEGHACVDGVCYAGAPQRFDLQRIEPALVAAGLELLPPGHGASVVSPQVKVADDGTARVAWSVARGLAVTAPTRAAPYPKTW